MLADLKEEEDGRNVVAADTFCRIVLRNTGDWSGISVSSELLLSSRLTPSPPPCAPHRTNSRSSSPRRIPYDIQYNVFVLCDTVHCQMRNERNKKDGFRDEEKEEEVNN